MTEKELQKTVSAVFDRAMEELRGKDILNEDDLIRMMVTYAVVHYEAFFQKPVEPFLQQLRPTASVN